MRSMWLCSHSVTTTQDQNIPGTVSFSRMKGIIWVWLRRSDQHLKNIWDGCSTVMVLFYSGLDRYLRSVAKVQVFQLYKIHLMRQIHLPDDPALSLLLECLQSVELCSQHGTSQCSHCSHCSQCSQCSHSQRAFLIFPQNCFQALERRM